MSQISLMPPFEGIRGKFGKNVIIRQKKFRAPNGKVLFKGAKESYPLENPRDYTKNPPKAPNSPISTSLATSVIKPRKSSTPPLTHLTNWQP